ncbi:MAG: hypothetical protein WA984_03675 [Phormidesmis sp.]
MPYIAVPQFLKRKSFFSKLLLGGFVFSSTSVFASSEVLADRYTDQVNSQLIFAAAGAGYNGNDMTHDPFIGSLGRGGNDNITLHLSQGVTYSLVGVCDEDCSDLDIVLYDDNGNIVASDLQPDDFPVVTVTPRWNAQFTINVRMVSCSIAPCRFGVSAFGR